MVPRRKTVMVCSFCGDHYQENESNKHGENCNSNPNLKSCGTCERSKDGKCKLGLIPIDFKLKKRRGRNCLSWELKDAIENI